MKKINSLLFMLTAVFWFLTLSYHVSAASPSLSKENISLHIGQSLSVKIKQLPKTSSVKWSVRNKAVATVSKTGRISAVSKGSTTVIAKIYQKNRLSYTLTAKVKVDGKGYASNNRSLKKLLSDSKIDTIILNGKIGYKFIVPKGNFAGMLEVYGKNISISIADESFVNSLSFVNSGKFNLSVAGQLAHLYVKKEGISLQLDTTGTNSVVNSVYLEKESKLNLNSAGSTSSGNIYVLAKADISISGNGEKREMIMVRDTAKESSITLDKNADLYTDANIYCTVNNNGKDSKLTTLDYKISVTLTNNTANAFTVITPSVEKTVEAGSTRTVNGKR